MTARAEAHGGNETIIYTIKTDEIPIHERSHPWFTRRGLLPGGVALHNPAVKQLGKKKGGGAGGEVVS